MFLNTSDVLCKHYQFIVTIVQPCRQMILSLFNWHVASLMFFQGHALVPACNGVNTEELWFSRDILKPLLYSSLPFRHFASLLDCIFLELLPVLQTHCSLTAQALPWYNSNISSHFCTSFILKAIKPSCALLQLAHRDHFSNQPSTTNFDMKMNITNQLKTVVQSW